MPGGDDDRAGAALDALAVDDEGVGGQLHLRCGSSERLEQPVLAAEHPHGAIGWQAINLRVENDVTRWLSLCQDDASSR